MEGKHYYVFSYGSNLLFERIQNRVKSVIMVKNYILEGYRLIFNKASEDGSVKANLEETGKIGDKVWGVIHKLSYAEKPILDQHETLGHGYQLICFRLNLKSVERTIHTYIANENRYTKIGKPYNWYMKLVIAGARQNQFPKDYISNLMKMESEIDTDDIRRIKNEEILSRAKVS